MRLFAMLAITLLTSLLTTVTFADDSSSSSSGVLRMKIPDAPQTASKPSQSLAGRYSFDNSQKLTVACPAGQEVLSIRCDAHTAGVPFFNEVRQDVFANEARHDVFTKTSVFTRDQINLAECGALNVKPDEIVKVTMSYRCSGGPGTLTASN
jgi:hypothetical protein